MKKVIHWFRRDLRLTDNSALLQAIASADQVIPVFCWDDHILTRPDVGAPRVWFLLESLKVLADKIQKKNGRLVILNGKPEEEIPRFAKESGAEAVFFNKDYEPYARRRDGLIQKCLEEAGISAQAFDDLLLVEPEDVATVDGRPFSVFTPFYRAWSRNTIAGPAKNVNNFGGSYGEWEKSILPSLDELNFPLPVGFDTGSWTPGEDAAQDRLNQFANSALNEYPEMRDIPSVDGTSKLSPYLKFGNISMRQVYEATHGCEKFVAELAWREFYFHVLWHWPEVEKKAWQESKRNLEWDENDDLFQAWADGRTGYPIVDAGMRQLLSEGWMHNRVRMIVASFLTKDLHLNWQQGERHFMLHLVDGDLAPNNGGWQWAAGTGVDPRPLRIFNPWLQSERFDPDGEYIRRWVPELTKVPSSLIHRPHLMSEEQQAEFGCVIGRDYPEIIVDHDVERKITQERYRDARDRWDAEQM